MEGRFEHTHGNRFLHVAAREPGADTALFFLHGAGGNKNQWRNQWAHFSGLPVNLVAWDMFGHGKSASAPEAERFSGEAMLGDLDAIVTRHARARNIFIGHSFGCRLLLAWRLQNARWGRDDPGDAFVLLGPATGPLPRNGLFGNWMDRLPLPLQELARPLLTRRFEKLAWHRGTDRALVLEERRATRGNTLAMMRALFAGAPDLPPDALSALAERANFLVGGAQDGVVPPDSVRALAGLLRGARLEIVEGCGHQIMLEKPDLTNDVIEVAAFGGVNRDA